MLISSRIPSKYVSLFKKGNFRDIIYMEIIQQWLQRNHNGTLHVITHPLQEQRLVNLSGNIKSYLPEMLANHQMIVLRKFESPPPQNEFDIQKCIRLLFAISSILYLASRIYS